MTPRLPTLLFLAGLSQIALIPAYAQTGNSVGSGIGSNAGTMTGPNIDTANGTAANGTPMAQAPGASMTVGAGNSTMLPGATGTAKAPATIPPQAITHGTTGTTSGTLKTSP